MWSPCNFSLPRASTRSSFLRSGGLLLWQVLSPNTDHHSQQLREPVASRPPLGSPWMFTIQPSSSSLRTSSLNTSATVPIYLHNISDSPMLKKLMPDIFPPLWHSVKQAIIRIKWEQSAEFTHSAGEKFLPQCTTVFAGNFFILALIRESHTRLSNMTLGPLPKLRCGMFHIISSWTV